MKKYDNRVTAAVMAVAFMAMYLGVYRHVLIFHEQHYLFRFSWSYLTELVHQKGVWAPAEEFMAQFGYYPWLAAGIWTIVLVGVYLLTRDAIRRLTGLRDRLGVSTLLPIWIFFQTVDIDTTLQSAVKAVAAVVGIWIVALAFGRFIPKPRISVGEKWRWLPWVAPAVFCIALGGAYYGTFRARDLMMPNGKERHFTREQMARQKENERLMIKTIQAVRRSDWDEVTELVDRQVTTGTKNHLMTYFRAMALYHKGELLDRLFEHPQYYGPTTLFFPWKADKNQAEYGGYVYEQLGALNSALHWEFEALVGWGETAYHLINLSRYLIATGRGEQARKFIAPLKQTLFYRSTARELEAWRAADEVPGLRDALKDASQTPMRADNVLNIAGDCKYILMHDPGNEMARQYLMTTLLLANNLGAFYRNLQEYYGDGQKLPRMFEEALCLVRLNYGSERLAADGFAISPEVDADFRAFLAEKNKGKFTTFTPAQKATYWYYLSFLSPEGATLNF